jgi:hypothetical protein
LPEPETDFRDLTLVVVLDRHLRQISFHQVAATVRARLVAVSHQPSLEALAQIRYGPNWRLVVVTRVPRGRLGRKRIHWIRTLARSGLAIVAIMSSRPRGSHRATHSHLLERLVRLEGIVVVPDRLLLGSFDSPHIAEETIAGAIRYALAVPPRGGEVVIQESAVEPRSIVRAVRDLDRNVWESSRETLQRAIQTFTTLRLRHPGALQE